jgi:hypothetical protein
MRRTRSFALLIATLLTVGSTRGPVSLVAQTRRVDPNNKLATVAGFSVEYPKKDWDPLIGVGSALITFVHKSRDATIAIEQTKLKRPLAVADITELNAQLEEEEWQNRQPQKLTFGHQLFDINGIRVVVLDFTQPAGQAPARVRLYGIPRGDSWFRVICTAIPAAFDKHSATCQNIALSLSPTK